MVSPLALALLLVAGQAWKASTAPGPSSRAHQKVEGDCDSCHLPFKGLPNEKCLTCHTGLKKFHASVAAQKCVACHGEHKGADADLTRPAARKSFDHGLTGMPLIGAHQKLTCEKCHSKPMDQMGNSCAGCHRDVHAGALGASCSACHGSTAWKPALKTKEQHAVSMAGAHATLACVGCHAQGKNLASPVPCGQCHERAHGGTTAPCEGCHQVTAWKPAKFDHSFCTCTLPQLHQTVGCLGCHQDFNFTSAPQVCSGCHEKERKHEALGECSLCHSAVSWKKNQFDHNKRSKMKLTGEHLKVACEGCHPAQGKTMKFRGVPLQCEGCHQKQGDVAHGDFGACAKCHTVEGFEKTTFDHASTGFPLTGQHVKLACKDCHSDKVKPKRAELPWSFRRTTLELTLKAAPHLGSERSACINCHADPHGSQPKCESCHVTQAWKPSTFTTDRHAQTKFPLTGKHLITGCSLCHTENKLNDAPLQCAGCHVDRHGGKLGAACETCHSTTAFKPASGFKHELTGFALKGGHARVSCASCHQGKRGTAMAAAAKPAECITCHQAQHGAELGAECGTCHDPEKGPFSAARGMAFAHEKTGFALERRHVGVRCGACHPAAGPPPSEQCGSCHRDPHHGQAGLACEQCHQADRFRVVRFDHDRSGWPLRGKHFTTPCVRCHTGQRWVGLTTECWECHAKDAALGKAVRPDKHPFGPLQCETCHTSGWRW